MLINLFYGVFITTFTASAAFAQMSADYYKNEFYGGFSHLRLIDKKDVEDDVIETPNLNGFSAAYTRNFHRFLGAKVQFSGNYTTRKYSGSGSPSFVLKRNVYTVTGGIQVKDNAKKGRLKPFAQALIGYGTTENYLSGDYTSVGGGTFEDSQRLNYFAATLGGGLDVRINKRLTIRAIEVNYVKAKAARFFTSGNLQIGVGIVIH